MPALCLAAGLLVTAGLLITTEISSIPFAALLVVMSAEALFVWKAHSRAAFAAILAGGLLWTLKRQNGRRRALMGLGAIIFGLGALWQSRESLSARSGPWHFLLRRWLEHPWLGCGAGTLRLDFPAYALALAQTGVIGFAVLVAAPALFLAWFLGKRPALAAEGPALAALGLFFSGLVAPDLFSVAALATAAAAIALSLILSTGKR